ncbi:MAG: acetoacetyl-CoA reductase [Hyphomicrobiales bacterium]|nr:acetoacetyl-CoA reductase [Hyphomicrobiales bacterium]
MAKRIALVTGGTRGIGHAISIALQKAGYTVAANYAKNDAAAKAFHKETGIHVFKWNVKNLDECVEGVARLEKDLGGPVDVLINNAGITRDSMLHKMSSEDWHHVLETNLTSCFNMSRAVIPNMRERGFGRIINISSINAQMGQMGQTNYAAAKAGMLGFTKSLARENAIKGITVNAVAPGYTNTEMIQAVPEKVMEKIIAQIPVGRVGEPEDIARCVVFLAADDAGFITGETISVNGGHHME